VIISYFSGLVIGKLKGEKIKKYVLTISILLLISALFVFKYYNFFITNFRGVVLFLDWNQSIKTLKLILPVGLSFYTFQSISYVLEVYKGCQKPERHFGIYALYIMFFPQILAGPIERSYNMLPQFRKEHKFEYERVVRGMRLILWGAFLKVIIADRAAVVVNLIYENLSNYSGPVLIIAIVLYSFQIFCDFAGYSNMAIGIAQILGFRLTKNFDRPYMSKSIKEFWNRWHISLSSWLRDYIYIPLGGNRVSKIKHAINIMVTFIISGLWHGAGWTFVAWGALHGFYLLFFDWMNILIHKYLKIYEKSLNRFDTLIQRFITFSLVTFSWIFFRAKDMSQVKYIISHMLINYKSDLLKFLNFDLSLFQKGLIDKDKILGLTVINWLVLITSIIIMSYVHRLQDDISIQKYFENKPVIIRWFIYYVFIIAIFYFATQGKEQYIYFQF
jgi:D-alanyl-lipoteichoic acid acyltransferase DltB (MBOAT superfamily)